MRYFLYTVVIIGLLISCKTGQKSTGIVTPNNKTMNTSRDGSSFENAIIIPEKSESKGVDAEYQWLRTNYPGYKSTGQSLNEHKGKNYDIIKIKTADGLEKSIYFDISNFFGKF
jgi:hypothetical protein